jgi:membrane associated rhomboid family serine protease
MATREDSPLVEVLAVFLVVFLLQLLTSVGGFVGGLFVLSPPVINNPWTVVTSVYAHASLGHLLSNSVGLILFGWPVARATTRLRFHAFFLVSGALAGIAQIVLTNLLGWLPGIAATGGVLGASGAVFALLGYLIAGNRLSTAFTAAIDVPRWVTYLAAAVLAGALTLATAQPGVALVAHFTGLLIGLAAGRVNLLRTRRSRSAQPTRPAR